MDGLRLLLVDDELEYRETLLKRMRKRQVSVAGVKSGEEALGYLEGHPTDVVVLDVRMPGMDGIQTLQAIKERHPLIEVIMLTGHASVEVAIRGMELGAFDYLMKPMDIDEILYKAQDAYKKKLLHEKRMQRKKGVEPEQIKDR